MTQIILTVQSVRPCKLNSDSKLRVTVVPDSYRKRVILWLETSPELQIYKVSTRQREYTEGCFTFIFFFVKYELGMGRMSQAEPVISVSSCYVWARIWIIISVLRAASKQIIYWLNNFAGLYHTSLTWSSAPIILDMNCVSIISPSQSRPSSEYSPVWFGILVLASKCVPFLWGNILHTGL